MIQFVKILNTIEKMSERLANMIMISMVRLEVRPGNYLIRSGQIPSNIYFVDDGLLEGYYSENEERISSGFWTAGSIIYHHRALWGRQEVEESLVALQFTVVYALPYDSILEIRNSFPLFRHHIIGLLDIVNYELEKKYHILSTRLPERRIEEFSQYYGFMMRIIPQNRLAAFLRMSEATFYRCLQLLGKDKYACRGKGADLPLRGKGNAN